jgi:MFS superfamily sulfate permease-like transporter
MICVVSLSSSLDIAAIEIELRRPLDYNHELKTVGLSNIVSGLTGGYTGSYIFSQSIFSLRMGIRSRLMGYSLAFFILMLWMLPINLLCYVPNFFFGSLLLMICLDLSFEWLIDVRRGITRAEYATVLATFALLQMLGLEFGIVAGCLLHAAMLRMGFNMGNDEEAREDDMAIANYMTTYE